MKELPTPNKGYEIICGDALAVLRSMESESVQTCVTSPPYFGLRDYGVAGQVGLEATPQKFVAKLVEIFTEVHRVLKSDGTCWLNLGDSYASYRDSKCVPQSFDGEQRSMPTAGASNRGSGAFKGTSVKHKDLIGIPWRVAFALQEAGWWLRQDIIWNKPNPMPESVTDRCTKSHEYIFLLTKSARYYYDAEAIKEPIKDASIARLIQDVENQNGSDRVPGKTNGAMKAVHKPSPEQTAAYLGNPPTNLYRCGNSKGRDRTNGNRNGEGLSTLDKKAFDPSQAGGGGINARNRSGYFDRDTGEAMCGVMANKKSVWTVTTQPMKEAHFATFPEKLITPCILAGSKEGDLILDPFSGAGTTLLVALKHKRRGVGIELNPEYIAIAEKRLREVQVKLF